ncbi:MAG: type II secretion system protein N [Cellvibrionaceae bacterium]
MEKITKSKLGLSLLGVLVFIISLLVNIPANVIIPKKLQGLNLHGIQGTLWQGSVAQISQNNQALPVQQLQWNLSALALLTGNISLEIEELNTPAHQASIRYSLTSDTLEVSNAFWELPVQILQPLLPTMAVQMGVKPQGVLALSFKQLTIEGASSLSPNTLPIPTAINGAVKWEGAIINTPAEELIFGTPTLALSSEGNQILGRLNNGLPSLLIKNNQTRCDRNTRRCELALDFETNQQTSSTLIGSLPFFGLKQDDNRWQGTVNFSL